MEQFHIPSFNWSLLSICSELPVFIDTEDKRIAHTWPKELAQWWGTKSAVTSSVQNVGKETIAAALEGAVAEDGPWALISCQLIH